MCLLHPSASNYTPLQYTSRKYLLENSSNDKTSLLATTTGGCTVNERPQESMILYGADVDIGSAYGTILRKLGPRGGRPRIYSTTSNESKILTLQEFFFKFENKLSKG